MSTTLVRISSHLHREALHQLSTLHHTIFDIVVMAGLVGYASSDEDEEVVETPSVQVSKKNSATMYFNY